MCQRAIGCYTQIGSDGFLLDQGAAASLSITISDLNLSRLSFAL